ncbi:CBS domain-containing protein [Natronospirillum operosum]|uniref:CBS domain-containing protein n=1 Tax=Natronospirillum operosum TaxID=2759953 RepID=A0A4Z0W4Z1_9GAMM|nr:CBS domain-containing protein [Natronospirillum operosum]TGG91761.1 CBS domain-containing protein [Natronospirillum operosum]
MLAKEIMVRDVVTISCTATLRQAISLMKKNGIKCLVVDKRHANDAYGMITYSTIVKTISAESGDIDLINVYDVYTKPVLSVGEDLDVRYVARLMTDYGVKRVLVCNNNDLSGLITMHDLVGEIMKTVD